MEFSSIGSGSKGNGTLVRSSTSCLMIDCGFSAKETERRLDRLGLVPGDLDAILVTHEHSDHVKGVAIFSRKHGTPVYMTAGTYAAKDYGDFTKLVVVRGGENFRIGDLEVTAVTVSHDAREPVQYIVKRDQKRLGVLTDVGLITPSVEQSFTGLDAMVVECNHDLDLLAMGPYPQSLKQRVSSHLGHLNNLQTANFLQRIDEGDWQYIVVAHVSDKNNSLVAVKAALSSVLSQVQSLLFADQDYGFRWLQIE